MDNDFTTELNIVFILYCRDLPSALKKVLNINNNPSNTKTPRYINNKVHTISDCL